MKRWQSLLLGLIISAATLAYALRGVHLEELGDEFRRGQYLYLLPAAIFTVAGLALRAVRWRVLLNKRITLFHSFHILNVSYLLNGVIPFRLGEVGRAYLATRIDPPISMFTSLSTVVVERVTDMLMVVILLVIAIAITPLSPDLAPVATAAQLSGLLAIVGMGVLVVFAARRTLAHRVVDLALRFFPFLQRLNLRHLTDRVLEGIAPLGSVRGAGEIFGWTVIAWGTSLIQGIFLLYVFYEHPTLSADLFAIGIASLAIAIPFSIGSVGPFEAAIVTGLAVGGLATLSANQVEPRAAACAVLFHLFNVLSYAVLGIIGLAQERISLGEVLSSAQRVARGANKTEAAVTPQQ